MSDELSPQIDVGDTVALASGGPSMTVVSGPTPDGCYTVAWFGDEDFVQEAKFHRDCLRITDGILKEESE